MATTIWYEYKGLPGLRNWDTFEVYTFDVKIYPSRRLFALTYEMLEKGGV